MWYNWVMKILAIESSCDETAAAVIGDEAEILSNVVVSQVDIFAAYGGVIPEVAARSHLEAILPVIHKALDDARLTKDDIDYIAVTYAPGLLGSLLIGTLTAKMLAILWGKPLYAVHHLKSHIYATWLRKYWPPDENASSTDSSSSEDAMLTADSSLKNPTAERILGNESELSLLSDTTAGRRMSNTACSASPSSLNYLAEGDVERSQQGVLSGRVSERGVEFDYPEFPLLAMVISGGHTQIIYMREHNKFEIIGTTRDDAVGECFDKVAKILGLEYPGGPNIAREAVNGDAEKYKLPHPKIEGLDFSFSGLKTAVLRAVQAELGLPITTPSYELAAHLTEQQRVDFAASFQKTACEILLEKLKRALEMYPEVKSILFAGGVSANKALREMAGEEFKGDGVKVYFPELKYSGDNAAMVGAAAYYEIMTGVEPVDPYALDILPRTPIK